MALESVKVIGVSSIAEAFRENVHEADGPGLVRRPRQWEILARRNHLGVHKRIPTRARSLLYRAKAVTEHRCTS